MRLTKLQFGLILGITLFVGYGIGLVKVNVDWKNYKPQLSVINREPPASLSTVDLTQFWAVWDKVNTLYYDKKVIDPQKMLNGAIQGLVSSLGDPYTMYLPPVQNNNFQQQLAGEFDGIGAQLGVKDNQIVVIAPLDGSPAQKAGIKAGDAIYKVDGAATDKWGIDQAVSKIRGKKGTEVVLTVIHKGEQTPTDIHITRDTITVKSVEGWVKSIKDINGLSTDFKSAHADTKVMYVRLSQFGDTTNQDWVALINNLATQYDGAKGMVLDLRSNPGGYLADATFIAGEFLPVGSPVVIQDPGNGDQTTLSVDRKGQLLQNPLVVLIDGGSASAAEIVSGALRDNGRAKLVGEQSFGKGTIQTALDLGQGAGLHVTIAKWLTPKGTWVGDPAHRGLTPDTISNLDPKDPTHDTQLETAIGLLLK